MRRAILLLLGACGIASAQLTTIQGVISLPTGQTPSGTLVAQWQYFVSPTGQVVPAGSVTSIITNGVVNVSLYPNIGSVPAGVSYNVTYSLSGLSVYTRRWYVPVSGSPVNLVNVEFPPQGLIGTSAIVSPAQITQSGAVAGQVLTWNGVLWLPSNAGGGGGSPNFNSITSGTNTTAGMIVGSGATLGYTGSGTIAANQ